MRARVDEVLQKTKLFPFGGNLGGLPRGGGFEAGLYKMGEIWIWIGREGGWAFQMEGAA